MRRFAFLLVLLSLALPAFAVQPSEVLDDPALEARARQLSSGLRCMVCQNQSIDDSDAELARDLRVLVRERLVAGETDEQVIDYVVSRYGEFVLLQPRFNMRNALLWAAPILLLAIGGAFIVAQSRRRTRPVTQALSAEEESRLKEILGDSE
ncbi:cytochrome c-type biogenesis protein [Aerobium aerolatum]|uniref:Cytochrome c-type biogenesis protein n=1 Tax=Aquamicrobium aerolatum DSM 21857 TaxID=1121003 RepID=A0A1I3JMF9_9HYPH|nr:cytochrome c-type biogenesis protein [Aquamicrobium aerolatum]SFI61441.1 cytochrome c-type biogenesis protein CcmH [Aquamicrobium aerolatum DSM 21857]